MKQKDGFLLIWALLLVFSCRNENKSRETIENLAKIGINDPKEYHFILIIPILDGCKACSIKSLDFLDKNEINEDVLLVFTYRENRKEKSEKLIQSYLNKEKMSKLNILYDGKDLAFKNNLVFSNPVLFTLSGNHILNQTILIPKNIENEIRVILKRE